jgi:hypothetical protein
MFHDYFNGDVRRQHEALRLTLQRGPKRPLRGTHMMKLTTALGVALASLTVAAYASPQTRHVMIHHAGHDVRADADSDGWISRAEAIAAADRAFDALDSNDDGKLDREDRPEGAMSFHSRGGHELHMQDGDCDRTEEGEGNERRVTVICRSEAGGDSERRVMVFREGDHEHVDIEREVRRAEREAQRAGRDADNAERRSERNVVIMRHGEGGDAAAPMPPMPPMPPFPAIMMLGGENEADVNGDGALSREEFRAQHARFFDASDANGDGRLRAFTPPQPPAPPTPPAPPRPR